MAFTAYNAPSIAESGARNGLTSTPPAASLCVCTRQLARLTDVRPNCRIVEVGSLCPVDRPGVGRSGGVGVVGRVEWSRRDPDEVESVVGIMLCRENKNATRIRPSRGDHGVDVYVPVEGRWTVYQVKSFTGPLNSSRKRQITESWNAFQAFVARDKLKVDAWHLLRPENPTFEDEAWLAKLTEGAPFPCRWLGLDYCDRLAADHQPVIDYYFHDGKERLAGAVSDLLAATRMDTSALTEPGQTQPTLEAIHRTINAVDPHFRYDFRVDTLEMDADGKPIMPTIHDSPGLVAAISSAGADGIAVTFSVFARFKEATSERPVPGQFTLVAEPGTAEAKAIEDFLDYGLPLQDASATNIVFDAPGGLGVTSGTDGILRLGPAHITSARPTQIRLVVLEGDSDVEVESADLMMDPPTKGMRGEKFAMSGTERNGAFDATFRFDPDSGRMNVTIAGRDLTGLDPTDVIAGIYVLTVLILQLRLF